jgi:hypothetical protein
MALKPSLRDVLFRLQTEELLPPSAEARALTALERHRGSTASMPWFVRVLTGFGAWVAALFLITFLAIVVVGKEAWGAILLGLVLCAGATGLRYLGSNASLSQLALASGLAGQGLFLGGVGIRAENMETMAGAAVVLFVVLLFAFPDPIQRFLSALGASLAMLFLLRRLASGVAVDVALVGIAALVHALFLHQERLQRGPLHALVMPTGFGLVTALFSVLMLRTFTLYQQLLDSSGVGAPAGVVTLGLATVTLYTTRRILAENGVNSGGAAGVTAFAALTLVALLTLRTPGVIAAAGVMGLAFHRRSVVLLGLAVAFVLAFGVSYYYDLELSLLAKSAALLGSGLVLLGLRLFTLRRFPAAPEVR